MDAGNAIATFMFCTRLIRLNEAAPHCLSCKGLIASDWRLTENNRRAKYYKLTRAGRRQLEKELSEWRRLSGAIALVLESA
jgi:PadR family transcriptional regulator, regulatory protein PadR